MEGNGECRNGGVVEEGEISIMGQRGLMGEGVEENGECRAGGGGGGSRGGGTSIRVWG